MFELKFHNVAKAIVLNNKNDNRNFLIDLLNHHHKIHLSFHNELFCEVGSLRVVLP